MICLGSKNSERSTGSIGAHHLQIGDTNKAAMVMLGVEVCNASVRFPLEAVVVYMRMKNSIERINLNDSFYVVVSTRVPTSALENLMSCRCILLGKN